MDFSFSGITDPAGQGRTGMTPVTLFLLGPKIKRIYHIADGARSIAVAAIFPVRASDTRLLYSWILGLNGCRALCAGATRSAAAVRRACRSGMGGPKSPATL